MTAPAKSTLYKYLNEDGTTPIQGYQWNLPTGKRLTASLALAERVASIASGI